jgi:hypothetical protein
MQNSAVVRQLPTVTLVTSGGVRPSQFCTRFKPVEWIAGNSLLRKETVSSWTAKSSTPRSQMTARLLVWFSKTLSRAIRVPLSLITTAAPPSEAWFPRKVVRSNVTTAPEAIQTAPPHPAELSMNL